MAVGSKDEMLRAARNQALYRQVNEKIEELNRAFDQVAALGSTWVCECADEDCTAPIDMTLGEYESIRSHPNRFAVLPGHVVDALERIVETHLTYVVVEKIGVGARFAIEHDPRRRNGSEHPS